jgi:AcrR family transcriptional regulator
VPKAFSAQERARIKARLLDSGRACFARYGLRKTTVADLVEPAGIAKASFYLFFESKEALYVDVLMAEMPAMIDRLLAGSFRKTDDARQALLLFMKGVVHEMETNPLARVLLQDPSELDRLAAALDVDRLLHEAQAMFAPVVEEIRSAQERGAIIAGEPVELVYALGLVKLFPLNRGRLPEPFYTHMLDQACRILADGLTCPARGGGAG